MFDLVLLQNQNIQKMSKFITLVIVLFSMSYNTNHNQLNIHTKFSLQEEVTKIVEPYNITFNVDKLKNNTYNLIIEMELGKDSHYVSPNSKGEYLGMFSMILEENTKLHMHRKFSEIPLSKESTDPWTGNPVNFVRENTKYTQQFTISDTNDFEVSGLIQFTIEPRCTLEKIHFTIKNTSENLEIKHTSTKH